MYCYPVELSPDDEAGGFVVTFPDIPAAITQGEDREEALAYAVGALETAFIGYMHQRLDIPTPSAAAGRPCVAMPALSCAKLALYQAMRDQGIRKAELARRLGLHMPQVDRLLDLRHASRLDQIESALRSLGKALTVSVGEAA